ncbi:MAG TPA: long-chain fatty acid--CoA ligase [Capillimicrobium sp.]|nr:long-chain fatty acid--CoA ligase [Capillimicrobium sp.]
MTTREHTEEPPPGLGGGNLARTLAAAAAAWPGRVALTHGGAASTFADLDRRSAQAAAMLAARGVAPGDRVALQLPNVPAFVDLYFGVLRLGATVVPMNPLLRGHESGQAVSDSQARLVVAWHEAEAPAGADVIAVEDRHGAGLYDGLDPAAGAGVADVDPDQTAVILYTSGTTGRPKGAELTHRNLGLNTREVIRTYAIVASDVFLGVLPLYHSFGQTLTLNAAVAMGARLALLTRFEAQAAAELVERERVTILMGVPTMLAGIAAVAREPAAFASVRICVSGGAPLPREQMDDFEQATGAVVLESYGLSETSPAATLNGPGARRVGSVGRPIDGVEVRILDEHGQVVPPDETGQIAIRGHNVMKGYWRRPDATAEAITADGWFLTGDLGRIDEDGFVYVVGRLKDLIIRGGLNVYPREVEEVLHRHPDVVEAAVVGVPDARLGEEVGAAVVLRDGATTDLAELREWVRARVAPYKYPRRLWRLDELPKGPTGKILKRAIQTPAKEVAS